MTLGVHKWSVLVEEGDYNGLGVASIGYSFEMNRYLGYQEGGWAYYSYKYRGGEAYHNSRAVKENLPTFQEGSKVTFILDLTGDGTLSASVDGKSFHQLFSDMRSKVRLVKEEFVPALYLPYSDDRVRFLGFEKFPWI
jgi:hypothetical protein